MSNKQLVSPEGLKQLVSQALKAYHDLPRLTQSELATFPAIWPIPVRSATPLLAPYARGVAVQGLLDEAIKQLAAIREEEAQLLHLHYRRNRPLTTLVEKFHLSRTGLQRRRGMALESLTSLVAQLLIEREEARQRHIYRQTKHLPLPLVKLFGFDAPLLRLHALLQAGLLAPSLIAIQGIGGSGKTQLVCEALRNWCQQEAPPLESILWATVTSSSTSREYLVMVLIEQLARQLGVPVGGMTTPESRLQALVLRMLAYRKAESRRSTYFVVVLDNIESSAEVEAALFVAVPLLQAASVILTSRIDVRASITPHHTLPVPELSEESALALIQQQVQQRKNSALAPQVARRLYQEVGGHPQALKLVAYLGADLPLAVILKAFKNASEPIHDIYRRVYGLAWQHLSSPARRVLFGLTFFPHSGVTDAGLRLLLNLLQLPDSVKAVWGELIGWNLLQQGERHAKQSHTYFLHQLTYTFVEQQGYHLTPDERFDTVAFAATYAEALIQWRHQPRRPKASPASLSDLVMTLLDRCHHLQAWDTFLRLLDHFGDDLQRDSHMGTLQAYVAMARLQPRLAPTQQVTLALLQARLLGQRGSLEAARAILAEIWSLVDTPLLEIEWFIREGVLRGDQEAYEAGEQALHEALELAHREKALERVSLIYHNLGNLYYKRKQYEKAQQHYHLALQAYGEKLGPLRLAQAEGGLGLTLIELQDYEAADHHLQAALRHYQAAHDRVGETHILLNQSLLSLRQEAWEEAERLASRALRRARRLGDVQREATAHHNLGYIYRQRGNYPRAVSELITALQQRRVLGKPRTLQTTETILRETIEVLRAVEPQTEQLASLIQRCLGALAAT